MKDAKQAVEIEALRKDIARLENLTADLHLQRDDWKEQARSAQRLIEDHSKRKTEQQEHVGWFAKLFTRVA